MVFSLLIKRKQILIVLKQNILGFKSINNQSINQVLLRMAQPLLKYLTKYVNIFPRNVTFATWFVVDF